ncbi:hypothetical protein GCM10023325_04620 [Sphingomonas lutea]
MLPPARTCVTIALVELARDSNMLIFTGMWASSSATHWRNAGGCVVNCDLSYFRRRASEERTAALNARHPRARQIHVAMSETYEEMVRAIVAREQEEGTR